MGRLLLMQGLHALRCTFLITHRDRDLYAVGVRHGIALRYVHTAGLPPRVPGGLSIRPECEGAQALPMRPIAAGFAINTVFYAAILGLPFVAVGQTCRRRRIRRGRCVKCGYDLRGDHEAGCPECGWNREKATA